MPVSAAPGPGLAELFDSTNLFFEKKDYKNAIVYGEKALNEAGIGYGEENSLYALNLQVLGFIYASTEKHLRLLKKKCGKI